MTDLKLPELPEAVAIVIYHDGRHGFAGRHSPWPDGSHNLYTAAQLRAYATAAVLAERDARGKALADGYAGSMFGTSPSSGDQQRVVLYYKTAEQALAAHDWLCDTLDAAMGGDDAR